MATVHLFLVASLWIATFNIDKSQCNQVSLGETNLILVIYSSSSDFDKNVTATLNETVALMDDNVKLEFYDLKSVGCINQTIPTLGVLIQKQIFHKSMSKLTGIVGPSCTDAAFTVAKLIKRSGTQVGHIHTSPMPLPLAVKVHKYTWGLRGSADLLAIASVALTKYANWSHVLALHQDILTDMNYIFLLFQAQLEDHHNTTDSSSDKNNKTLLFNVPHRSPLHLGKILSGHSARILFLMLDKELARNKLCQAFMLKAYYPAYQWVIIKITPGDLLSAEKVYMESYVCDRTDILTVLNKALFVNFQFGNCLLSSQVNKRDKSRESMSLLYECSIKAMSTILNNTEIFGNTSQIADNGTVAFDYNSLPTVPREVSIEQIQNNKPVQVFLYSTLTSSLRNVSENISLISSELRVEIRVVNLPVAISFYGINFTILLASAILQVITLVFRREKPVKSSSPVLLHFSYIGIYMLNIMTNAYFLTKSSIITSESIYINLCRTFIAMSGFGHTLVFGTLTMKTWRLYKIFVHYMDPGKYLSDLTLVLFVCCMTLVDLIIIVPWFVFDPIRRKYEEVDRNNFEGIITKDSVCDSELYSLLNTLLTGYQGLIMAVMVWLMSNLWNKIPKVHTNLQTSNSEIKLIYILLILFCFGTPSYWVAHSLLRNLIFEFVVIGVVSCSIQALYVVLLLLPPILHVLNNSRIKDQM